MNSNMTQSNVRVRFAPSPTGPLHIGGVRTALYNYLFAKQHGGSFILRVEDTDQTRFVPGAEAYIVEALNWCGIAPDEGVGSGLPDGGPHAPYRQSERKPMYRAYADQLLESGHAYIAFDSQEELTAVRERAKSVGKANFQYNSITRTTLRNSLTLSEDEVQRLLDAGEPYVIRMKIPRNVEVKFEDMVRGWVRVDSAHIDDKVLLKGDGMPTYHLANIVDDHLMGITHVIRGEEWLPSAPLHVLLYECFGWQAPAFAHLSLLLRPDGNGKLSKRDGDRLGFPVFPINWVNPSNGETASGYRELGFLPQGFINMLAFLGWNPGNNEEIFSLDSLVEQFNLSKVHKAGARFDFAKARWFNQQHLRALEPSVLRELLMDEAANRGFFIATPAMADSLIELFMERAEFISDILDASTSIFETPTAYEEKMVAKKWTPDAAGYVRGLKALFAETNYSAESLEASFKAYLASHELGFGQVGPVLRLAIAGVTKGPSIFAVMALLGQSTSESRMDASIQTLG